MKTFWTVSCCAILAIAVIGAVAADSQPTEAGEVEPKSVSEEREETTNMAKATFGAGCFWGVEAAFRQVDGVKATAVGYSGGHTENPTYREVCSDRTGHAEVVEVEYDPTLVTYETLLGVFWENHDPTQVNRQGPDIGSQYRSVIFFHSPEQEAIARKSKGELEESGRFRQPIATSIEPAQPFWKAEDYHQQYLEKRGLSTCKIK